MEMIRIYTESRGSSRHLAQFMVFYITEKSFSVLEKSWELGIA